MGCGILVPSLGVKPIPSAVEAWSPNHWTTKAFPYFFLKEIFSIAFHSVCIYIRPTILAHCFSSRALMPQFTNTYMYLSEHSPVIYTSMMI